MSVGKYADIHGWIDNKDNIVDIYGLPAEVPNHYHQTSNTRHCSPVPTVCRQSLETPAFRVKSSWKPDVEESVITTLILK